VLLEILQARGSVQIVSDQSPRIAIAPLRYEGGVTQVELRRSLANGPRTHPVELHGRDPSGAPRVLARIDVTFDADALQASAEVSLPAELRARLTHARIAAIRSAGAVTLSDDSLSRREVALFAGREDREA